MKNMEKSVTVSVDQIQVHFELLDDIKDAVIHQHQKIIAEHMVNNKIITRDEFNSISKFLNVCGEDGLISFSDIFIER
jgi:hypothetical protein